ncbi:hypothetical protein CROQUDRAFT_87311 [Cronartium quercuum f. sp. fusiforme G11]|uniref:Uncharacterized protein n=1 Tax=Cronartium quercuum f. sp. fusiforme G11 TaxID=708437 RepID=A0A9P6NV42_9BASI|nr:hypothetical protein CROQUDRAFT_87311 [Cronartium quercuum f. sp. fusiforme G11]
MYTTEERCDPKDKLEFLTKRAQGPAALDPTYETGPRNPGNRHSNLLVAKIFKLSSPYGLLEMLDTGQCPPRRVIHESTTEGKKKQASGKSAKPVHHLYDSTPVTVPVCGEYAFCHVIRILFLISVLLERTSRILTLDFDQKFMPNNADSSVRIDN